MQFPWLCEPEWESILKSYPMRDRLKELVKKNRSWMSSDPRVLLPVTFFLCCKIKSSLRERDRISVWVSRIKCQVKNITIFKKGLVCGGYVRWEGLMFLFNYEVQMSPCKANSLFGIIADIKSDQEKSWDGGTCTLLVPASMLITVSLWKWRQTWGCPLITLSISIIWNKQEI